jgi:hypothetical protein
MVLNGQEICRANLDEIARLPDVQPGFKRASGRIGLTATNGEVQFRNLRIKELAPGTAAEKEPPGRKSTKCFPARIPDETKGKWCIAGEYLMQPTLDEEATIFFGDTAWTDYDFSVEALRTDGANHCGLWFRHRDDNNKFMYAIGWDIRGGRGNLIGRWDNGRWTHPPPAAEPGDGFKSNTWYRARVSVRGDHGEAYLDDAKRLEFPVDHAAGCVGLRTWQSAYVFRNIKVTAPDGKVLLEGLPQLPGDGGK